MFEPIDVVVCARSAVGGAPERGARDQYIPLAGAGCTSGAALGSARGGKDLCTPRGARWAGGPFRAGVGDELLSCCFDAIADVDRRLRGLAAAAAAGLGVGLKDDTEGVPEIDGESGLSDLGILLGGPAGGPAVVGDFADLGDSN